MQRHFVCIGVMLVLVLILGAAPAAWAGKKKNVERVDVCHKPGHRAEQTLYLPEHAADRHVRAHGDTRGPCPPPARELSAELTGAAEVPPISTEARGAFEARVERADAALDYRLAWSGLEGDIRAAHIHFAPPGVNGGVIVWLCADPSVPDAPAATPTCAGSSGEVQGRLIADDIVGPADQGIEAGEGREALRAIRAGLTYVNIHSERYPAGEIRGAIQ